MSTTTGDIYEMKGAYSTITYTTTTDSTTTAGDYPLYRYVSPSYYSYQQVQPQGYPQAPAPEPKPKKEEDEMNLYTVYMVYAEDRKKPFVKRVDGVIAKNEEDAKVKSGLMKEIDESWDSDWLNFIVEEVGTVKVKPRPTEVKQV